MVIELGKVLKPQGIKGELKVLPLSKAEFLRPDIEVVVAGKTARITACSIREGYAYVSLDISQDRNAAEELRDAIISMPDGADVSLDNGEYLFADLVDCEVYTTDGEYVGKVVEVENYGATDILTIHRDFASIACPFLRTVFLSVDTRAKKIVVDKAKFNEVTDYED